MYSCLFKVVLGPDTRHTAQQIADFFDPLLRSLPGFEGNVYMANYEEGEYCSLTFWDTLEHLKDALRLTYPLSQKMTASVYQWAPSYEIFEIYQSKINDDTGDSGDSEDSRIG